MSASCTFKVMTMKMFWAKASLMISAISSFENHFGVALSLNNVGAADHHHHQDKEKTFHGDRAEERLISHDLKLLLSTQQKLLDVTEKENERLRRKLAREKASQEKKELQERQELEALKAPIPEPFSFLKNLFSKTEPFSTPCFSVPETESGCNSIQRGQQSGHF